MTAAAKEIETKTATTVAMVVGTVTMYLAVGYNLFTLEMTLSDIASLT